MSIFSWLRDKIRGSAHQSFVSEVVKDASELTIGAILAYFARVILKALTHNEKGSPEVDVLWKNLHKMGLLPHIEVDDLSLYIYRMLELERRMPEAQQKVAFCVDKELGRMQESELIKALSELSRFGLTPDSQPNTEAPVQFLIGLAKRTTKNERISYLLGHKAITRANESEYPKERIVQYALSWVQKLKALDDQFEAGYGDTARAFRENAVDEFQQFLEALL